MNKKKKRILTFEDLEKFYSKYKRSTHFSSSESGYQLAVQVQATFEKDNEIEDDTLLFCKAKFFHCGLNRNKSNVTEEAAEKAMKTMAYKPVLANFCEIEKDGECIKDFTSHDMLLDENGNIQYLEHQIGCITADEPWFEDFNGKKYICGYVAIPRNYTDAVDIIERKNGTKVSVELLINELSYDAKQKSMMLTDVTVSGLTCLGTNPETGAAVEEGMLGSRLDIKDFSKSNNSMFSSIDEEDKIKLIEMQTTISNMLSRFNINENYGKEEFGNGMENEINEVNEEITEMESVEEIEEVTVTETESAEEVTETPELTETESEETVEETPEVVEVESEEVVEITENEDMDNSEESEEIIETESVTELEETIIEVESENDETIETVEEVEFTKEFSLSHEDVRSALYSLLEKYEEANNDYYWIVSVYDEYLVYQSCCTGAYYGHKYSKDGDVVALEGDAYPLFAEFLTESEKAELESMRANYSSISEKLAEYELKEELADKFTVFDDEAYSKYLDTEEFKALMTEEVLKQFSKEELVEKADAALGKVVKTTKTFALKEEEKQEKKPNFFAFAQSSSKVETSFLDELLKK